MAKLKYSWKTKGLVFRFTTVFVFIYTKTKINLTKLGKFWIKNAGANKIIKFEFTIVVITTMLPQHTGI